MRGKLFVLLLIAGLLAAPAVVLAQEVVWVRQIATWGDDFAYDVDTDPAGNVYLAGALEGSQPSQPVTPHRDAFIAKYTATGQQLWRKTLATEFGDYAHGIAVDAQGNAYVAGASGGTLPGQSAEGGGFLAKFGPDGALLWLRQFESEGFVGYDEARAVAIGPDGNIVVAGFTDDALPGWTSNGGDDCIALKFSPAGDQIWAVQFGTSGNDQANGIDTDDQGNIYVAASFGGSLLGNYTDAALIKLKADGMPLWLRLHNPDALNNYGNDVVADGAGNAYLIAGVEGTEFGGSYAMVRKYNPDGGVLWTDKFSTPATSGRDDSANNGDLDPAGNLIVSGKFAVGTYPGQTNSGDLFARKYQPDGTVLWTHQFGPTLFAYSEGVAAGPGGAVYLAAYSESAFPGGPEPDGYDAYLVALDTPAGPGALRTYLPMTVR